MFSAVRVFVLTGSIEDSLTHIKTAVPVHGPTGVARLLAEAGPAH